MLYSWKTVDQLGVRSCVFAGRWKIFRSVTAGASWAPPPYSLRKSHSRTIVGEIAFNVPYSLRKSYSSAIVGGGAFDAPHPPGF